MCGRLGVAYEDSQLGVFLDKQLPEPVQDMPSALAGIQRGEVRPTQRVFAITRNTDGLRAHAAHWTLVPPWAERSMSWGTTKTGTPAMRFAGSQRVHFNSRADTLTSSAGWQRLLRHHRCLILASTYTEWSDVEMLAPGEAKRTGVFSLRDEPLLPLAGIGCWVMDAIGRPLLTVSVITTLPNDMMRRLPHHRMPAILRAEAIPAWLNRDEVNPERWISTTPDEALTSTEHEAPSR